MSDDPFAQVDRVREMLGHLRDTVTEMETYLDRGLMFALALPAGSQELGSQPSHKLKLLIAEAKRRDLMPTSDLDRLHNDLREMFDFRGRTTHAQVFPAPPPADAMLIRTRAGIDEFTPITVDEIGRRAFDIVGVSRGLRLRARLWELVVALGGGLR